MNQRLFTGCAAALITPFCDGEIDFPAFRRLIERQIAGGTDALVVCGTTGEPPTLAQAEKDVLLAAALECADGRVPVYMGTGSNCTACSVRQSVRAQQLGADGLLVVTPYYNRPSQAGLSAHFTAVADAVSLPVILYNVPSRTGVNLLPETAAALAAHENICGVKEASGNVSQAAELMRLSPSLAVYAGNDDQTLPLLALGAQGVISVAANAAPELMHRLTDAFFTGDLTACRETQLSLLPLIRLLFCEVNPVPVKAALELIGLCRAEVRLPLTPLSPEQQAALQKELTRLGLTG